MTLSDFVWLLGLAVLVVGFIALVIRYDRPDQW
jgi:hypothetical protein